MTKVTVLGAGRVGKTIVEDLAQDNDFQVWVADNNVENLKGLVEAYGITPKQVDLAKPEEINRAISDSELAINALPGALGYQAFKTVVNAGKHLVDIAFFAEDPFSLQDLAINNGVIAAVDCGVAPGMSNLLVGYVDHLLDRTERVRIYVGGLPKSRDSLYQYKAAWSPIDVIEEYTRPARLVRNHQEIAFEPMTELETLEFNEVGDLEAFNTDGLRTLIQTIHAQDMAEKTLRYPGHAQQINLLRKSGFFDRDPLNVNGHDIAPIDLTAKVLLPLWELEPGEADITVMRVVVEGTKDKQNYRYTYDLYDEYDAKANTSSMARTTGYTATQVARLILGGGYTTPGITPLELVGKKPKAVDFILNGLKERNVQYLQTTESID